MQQLASSRTIAVFIFAIVLATASSVFAQWVGPTATPPGNNVSAPLNVGATTQTKTGGLWADSMGTDNGYCIGADCITSWADTVTDNSVVTTSIVNSAVTTGKTDFVGSLEEGKWCSVSGGDIVCTNDAPNTGTVSGTVVGGGTRSCSDSTSSGTQCSCSSSWGSATCSGSQVSCPWGTSRITTGGSTGVTYQLCITN